MEEKEVLLNNNQNQPKKKGNKFFIISTIIIAIFYIIAVTTVVTLLVKSKSETSNDLGEGLGIAIAFILYYIIISLPLSCAGLIWSIIGIVLSSLEYKKHKTGALKIVAFSMLAIFPVLFNLIILLL